MKWPLLVCALLLSSAVHAQDAPPIPLKQAPSNVTIINGKRFYSLQNVRRFHGSTNSPKALSVIHHPHGQEIANARRPSGPIYPPAASPSAGDAKATTGNTKPDPDQVLSIFAPEDKHAYTPGPTK